MYPVSCLPALESVDPILLTPLVPRELGCLLEALAWCPRLRALDLLSYGGEDAMFKVKVDDPHPVPFLASGCALAFAKLRSLTKLSLTFGDEDLIALADVVNALVPLTGLAELKLGTALEPAVLPAALEQLKGLRSLDFHALDLVGT